MTTDSPKGPETDPLGTVRVHPADDPSDPGARRKVKLPITREPGAYWRDLTPDMGTPPHVYSNEAIADWPVQALSDVAHALGHPEAAEPELERLTAEVERLQVELGTIRGEPADFAQESLPSHVSTLQAVRWLIAEHDEQVKHNDEVGEENRALCNERDEWNQAAGAEADLLDQANAEVSRLREQLAAARTGLRTAENEQMDVVHALGYSGQEEFEWDAIVDAVRDGLSARQQLVLAYDEARSLREQLATAVVLPQDAEHQLWLAIREHRREKPNQLAGVVLDLLRSWGASSSEVEAPQPAQHVVDVTRKLAGWVARCRTCVEGWSSAVEREVQDWKDRHEADTLVPQVKMPTGGAIIDMPGLTEEQEDALLDRIAELTEVMSDRIRSAMPVSQHVDGESGETFWTVQVGHAAKVAARVIAQLELQQQGEGRPSGSERLAPRLQSVFVGAHSLKEACRYCDAPGATSSDTATDRYHFADVGPPRPVETFDCKQDCPAVAPECFCVGTEPHRLCCHEDAAQAARSEATPEDPQPHMWPPRSPAPDDSVQTVIAENDVRFKRTPWGDWEAVPPEGNGRGYSWARINEFMTLTEVPSPSLRKEGEDTPSPSVSTQEETKGGETDG